MQVVHADEAYSHILKNVEKLRLCKKTEGMKAYVAKIDANALEVVDNEQPKEDATMDKLVGDEQLKDTTLEDVVEDLPDNVPH
ncbi:hypothetical protein GGI17_003412 [Coemansia sp. S146]|nr:hypothetical protein GGI17_003412 [Coemansia sp. S146]